MTKYDRLKSCLIESTTATRTARPEQSTGTSKPVTVGGGDAGDRKTEAAIPSSSDPYQAILRRTFSGSGPLLVCGSFVGFCPLQHTLVASNRRLRRRSERPPSPE